MAIDAGRYSAHSLLKPTNYIPKYLMNYLLEGAKNVIQALGPEELATFRQWFGGTPNVVPEPYEQDPLEECFTTDGDLLTLKAGIKLTPDDFATLTFSSRHQSHKIYALYEAWTLGTDFFERVISILRLKGMTSSQITNLKHVATSVLPFMKRHGLRANPWTVNQVIAAMRNRDGSVKRDATARALFALLKQPNISQAHAETVRERYERHESF